MNNNNWIDGDSSEWELIQKLTEKELNAVTIYYDNADFSGPNCRISVSYWCSKLVKQVDQNYYGESKIDCLRDAYDNMVLTIKGE